MPTGTTDFLDDMLAEAAANSPFAKLAHIGDSLKCFRLQNYKPVEVVISGAAKKVVRMTMLVEVAEGVIVEKTFDNGSQRFIRALKASGVVPGSSFTLTRGGANEKEKTEYIFTNVVNPPSVAPGKDAEKAKTDPAAKPAAPNTAASTNPTK